MEIDIDLLVAEKPSYYGILPSQVRYDTDLSPSAKIFYTEITVLSGKDGYCWASNTYFSKLYDVDPSTVTKWLGQLKDKGYVHVEYEYNGSEIKKRKIFITEGVLKKRQEGIEKTPRGCGENAKDNITSNNTTSIVSELFEFWNTLGIQRHKALTTKAKAGLERLLKTYKPEEIKQSLNNYAFIVKNPGYYFNYRWTLQDFIARGFEKFYDLEIAKSNYKGNNQKTTGLGDETTHAEILEFTKNESAEYRKSIFDQYEGIGNGKFKRKK